MIEEITFDDFSNWLPLARLFKVPLETFKKEDLEKIYFIKTPKDNEPLAINGFIALHKKPILPLPGSKNIAIIPGLYNYAISNRGHVTYLKERRFIQGHISRNYEKINIISPNTGNYIPLSIHRLVAFTWVKNSCVRTKTVVNHIDGNKLNNHFRNLEWVTILENNIHAINTGLCPYTHKVRVFDVQLQTEHFFYSLEQARKFMGFKYPLNVSKLSTVNGVLKKRFEVRLEDDQTPWKFLGKSLEIKSTSSKRVLVQAKNFTSGETLEVLGIRKLSRLINVEISIIKRYLNDKRNIIYKDWMFRLATNEPWPEPDEKRRELKIKLFNPKTSEELQFESVKSTLNFLGTNNHKTLLKYVNTGEIYRGYIVSY